MIPVKNNKVDFKTLAKLLGYKEYPQSFKNNLKKAGILADGKWIKVKDLEQALELHKPFILKTKGEDFLKDLIKWVRSIQPEKKKATEQVEPEPAKKELDFSILKNPRIMIVVAIVAMAIQAIVMAQFLLGIHGVESFTESRLETLIQALKAICFQMIVLFLSYKGRIWGKIWVGLFAAIDWLVNCFIIDFFETPTLEGFIATIVLPMIIGTFLTLLNDEIK